VLRELSSTATGVTGPDNAHRLVRQILRNFEMRIRHATGSLLIALLSIAALAAAAPVTPVRPPAASAPALWIVQGTSVGAARASVTGVGARVDQQLDIIRGVSAYLNPWQVQRLRAQAGVRLYENRTVTMRGSPDDVSSPGDVTEAAIRDVSEDTSTKDGEGVVAPTLMYQTAYPLLVGADSLQKAGITGKGVTIAVLDTGLWEDPAQNYGSRVLATRDVTKGGSRRVTGDPYGHGTHITSIAAGGAQNLGGGYLGVAPQANLVVVRAFDGAGAGRYVDVIAGLNWIVAHKSKYHIRVLNLSFGSPPHSYYWKDPLAQAVMAAWRAGIVVVASAGNEGPKAMTIDVPGNVPYVVTVGALTDNYTPYDPSGYRLASFSSTGPTYEGFVKPEMVAPGGHMVASMSSSSYLANIDPGSMLPTEQLFTM
jgi:serine protease AprX